MQPLHSPEAQPLGLKTPAPVDPEVRDLPDVSASWFKPSGSAARLYLLEVGPHSTKHPPLVLFHGAGSGGNRVFYPVLAALSSKRHVIAVDLPGFGRSERRGDDFAPDQMVRQVASVVDALGVRRIDVLGHSSGGPLALLFAAQSPKLVRRLVLRRSGRRAAARDAAAEPAARGTQRYARRLATRSRHRREERRCFGELRGPVRRLVRGGFRCRSSRKQPDCTLGDGLARLQLWSGALRHTRPDAAGVG